jgi:hypothetical protein
MRAFQRPGVTSGMAAVFHNPMNALEVKLGIKHRRRPRPNKTISSKVPTNIGVHQ